MSTRIKVLHIIKSLGRGGAEMLLPETLRLHDREKFEFHYAYFLPWKDQMVNSIREHDGQVVCFSAGNNLVMMTKLGQVARYIRENQIQLIHAHLPWAGILARLVGKVTGVPVIYTEHNKQERYHFLTRYMNLLSMNMLTTIVAVSDDVALSIRNNKPRLVAPLKTIVNGVNVEKFQRSNFTGTEVRERLSIPADALVIGTIAVFRFQKRLDLWMELAAEILNRVEKAHFIIVGDGPLREQLIEKRKALGLQERIHLPGLETEVRPYFAAFDIFMMSSVFEGLPIALLEGMSMECAVISTDAGGVKEVIRHEMDGLVCPVDQPEKLVGFATELSRDGKLRASYGRRARERVLTSYSLKTMVDRLEQLYHNTITKNLS